MNVLKQHMYYETLCGVDQTKDSIALSGAMCTKTSIFITRQHRFYFLSIEFSMGFSIEFEFRLIFKGFNNLVT